MEEDRGSQLQAVVTTFVSTAVVATSLRCYTRAFVLKGAWGIEDWLMVLATVSVNFEI